MRLVIGDLGDVHIDWSDPELSLTADQRAAMCIDREVVVTAGAGAGKTHTLSLRYVHLLLQLCLRGTPDIEAVLVLTFTEKAAAEMAERCYRRLLALSDALRAQRQELDALDGPQGRPLGAHLVLAVDRLRDAFDRARIGTFHAFCARILREHPAETGVPGRNTVADAIEAAQATDTALDLALRQLFRERPQDLPILLDALGSRRSVMAAGRTALSRRAALATALERHAGGHVDLESWLAEAPVSVSEAQRFVDEVAVPTLDAIRRVAAPAGGPWPAVLQDLLAEVRDRPRSGDAIEAALNTYSAYRAVLSVLLTSNRRIRRLDHHSVLGTKAQWMDPRRFKKARAAMQVLQGRCADWEERASASRSLPVRADRDLLIALSAFSRFALDARDHLHTLFAQDEKIDFTDMQIRAVRAVLEQPAVRASLRARFRYLMVDEFQDTDELQWSLIKALGRDGDAPSDRIFLVGDPKQAIYGFRGGDITLFRRAASTLSRPPVLLADNFRSQPALINWFNHAFPDILTSRSGPDAPWEAPYDAMRACRPGTDGSVTALFGDPQDHHWESEACAQLIASEVLTDALRDRDRYPSPPIAILLRRRTHLQHYEAALRRSGIPFIVAQGVGFWGRPEVLDLVNTLHAIATGTPSSIVGALRSPIFCLDDQDVFDLPDIAGFGRAPITAEMSPSIHRADARYRLLLAQRYRCTVSQLLRHLVDLAAPAWRLESGPTARQARANAERLVDMAARFDDRGQEGLLHASEAFLRLVLSEARASEAIIAPTQARVVIMTIHAAKGLEFPAVLIPELHARVRPDNEPLAVARLADGRWRMATAVPDTDAEVQRRTKPGLLNALRDVRESENYAEYRRLFYVAATRARDQLFLIGERPPTTERPRRHPTWAEILSENLPPNTRLLDLTALRPASTAPCPTAGSSAPSGAPETLAPLREPVEISASGLDLYVSCPARWYRAVFLGIPETAVPTRELARNLAAARGRVIHTVLEDGVSADEDLIRARWFGAAMVQGCTPERAAELLHTVIEPLRRTRRDPHLQRILTGTGRAEVPFRVAAGPVVLRGQIDHLYRDDEGWIVLDYKSERLDRPLAQAAQRHQRQLLAYGWAADRILSTRGQGRVVGGEVYFTAAGAAHRFGPWCPEDLVAIEALLADVSRTARTPWAEVEKKATQRPRPCAGCGFLGRGCRGSTAE